MKTLNIVGCGKVGRTLARLWARRGAVRILSVLNRSLASGQAAIDFLGSGRAIEDYAQMEQADLIMISAADEAVETCCRSLCRTSVVRAETVVFHCSGFLPSTSLAPAQGRGAAVAGIHPVKSFADPASAEETFAGTFCALEGDPRATEFLERLLRDSGATVFSVKPEEKAVYHAATVVVCNYLVALLEVGLRCFQRAGVDRTAAMQVMEPMVRGTLANVFRLGPVQALTGPIARGEPSVVKAECDALGKWDPAVEQVYRTLGRMAVEISAAQGNAGPDALDAIRRSLQG
jgi:predicted short-subunit dehydrogenase-like oxidoreductase (DUF2520 family)